VRRRRTSTTVLYIPFRTAVAPRQRSVQNSNHAPSTTSTRRDTPPAGFDPERRRPPVRPDRQWDRYSSPHL